MTLLVILNLFQDLFYYLLLTMMKRKQYFIYIIGNEKPVLYVGVTSNLIKRIYQHKMGLVKGFSSDYGLVKLLYFEPCNDVKVAIEREKQLKRWHREWKLNLIREKNPEFKDLFHEII